MFAKASDSQSSPLANYVGRLLTTRGFALLLAAIILILYFPVAFGMKTFSIRDYSIFAYPFATYVKDSIWRGEMPLWDPYNNCGIPFLAQWSTISLYPGSLIYILLPLPWSLGIFCLAHLFWAGLGMFRLARELTTSPIAAAVAGLTFALNGFTANCIMWPAFLASVAWAPWVILLARNAWQSGRRNIAIAALAGGCQMLSGGPEAIVITWLLAGLLWIAEGFSQTKPVGLTAARIFGIVVLVALLSAAQLLPFFDLLSHSDRSKDFAGTTWSLPLSGFANFLVPLFRFYRSPSGVFFQIGQDWTSSYYMGIGTVALAVWAMIRARNKTVWIWAAVTIFFLLLALGDQSPVYPSVRKIVPQLGFMRFPMKFVTLAVITLPILAAFGIRCLETATERERAKSLFVIVCIPMLAAAGILYYAARHRVPGEDANAILWSGISRPVFLILIGVCILAVALENATKRAFGIAALLALTAGDLITHAPSQNPIVPNSVYERGMVRAKMPTPPNLGEGRAMMTRATHDRLYSSMLPNPATDLVGRRLGFFGDLNLLDSVPTIDGFFPSYLQQERYVWSRVFFAKEFPAPLADFLSISAISDPQKFLEWAARTNAMPILTLGQKPVFAEPRATLDAMSSPDFRPREVVYLPTEASAALGGSTNAGGQVVRAEFSTQKITGTVEAPAATTLVLSQSFYHRWRAAIDGTPTRIWRANYNFQAIEVPAGRHEIVFTYDDPAFKAGAVLSIITLIACGFIAARKRGAVAAA